MTPESPVSRAAIPIIARLAHEGVPVRAIARSFMLPSDDVRAALQECIMVGGITDMPKDDWPPGQKRGDRVPALLPHEMSEKEMLFACHRTMKLTGLEAHFLIVLLRKNVAEKDTLHHVVEQQREARRTRPDDPEPTDPKMVDVVICKLRTKLRPHSVEIRTVWGRGYVVDEANRRKVREILLSANDPDFEARYPDPCPRPRRRPRSRRVAADRQYVDCVERLRSEGGKGLLHQGAGQLTFIE